MNIAIIPARGGSKRIPRKNIRPFAGKPLIAYTIEAAVKSGLFDHVIVSTDDAEIAAVAREYGATTPFERPAELANDYATTIAAYKTFLKLAPTDPTAPEVRRLLTQLQRFGSTG